ncbi:hypothetical protein PTI98_001748 [Pleurotus ostreatus]|nr:hypothetical protein PTI98_001748 [Pleurotus ostreatus]
MLSKLEGKARRSTILGMMCVPLPDISNYVGSLLFQRQCKANTAGFPGSTHKSFPSRREAEDWLKVPVPYAQAAPKTLSGTQRFHPITAGRRHLGSIPPRATPSTAPDEGESVDFDADVIPLEPQTPDVKLSPEQAAVLNKVKSGKSIFFTGSAGTGKSVLLREIIRTLGGNNSRSLAITASTGIAAVNIGGTTLHSWAGIGLGLEPAKNLAGKFLGQGKFRPVLDRWRAVKYLIIDEGAVHICFDCTRFWSLR